MIFLRSHSSIGGRSGERAICRERPVTMKIFVLDGQSGERLTIEEAHLRQLNPYTRKTSTREERNSGAPDLGTDQLQSPGQTTFVILLVA
uniref:Uncharacterized protein n=1 Tax=Romanomermis culicivorax TaxID=13658 RepID=A0A915IT30_ROMCU